jgi:hypothetical protein
MSFHWTPLRRLAILPGALLLVVFSARAQQGGEPIIFSSPTGGGVSSNLTSLSKPDDLPNTLSFTPSGLGPDLPSGPAPSLPAIPAAVSISEGQQLQNLLNPKKDWTLMTPSEIMGVSTPEKILQVPERDAMGLRENPDSLENFLGRQDSSQPTATNGYSKDNSLSAWHFQRNDDLQPGIPSPIGANVSSIPSSLGQLFSQNSSGHNGGGNVWQNFGRSSPVSTSLNTSRTTTELDQFKKLLGMGSAVDSSASATPISYDSSSSAFSSSEPSPDNNFSRPVANPVGTSYIPLSSGIGTPMGLPSLPTLTGQGNLQSAITPAWTPQAPPWTDQGPQPFVIPQRKF